MTPTIPAPDSLASASRASASPASAPPASAPGGPAPLAPAPRTAAPRASAAAGSTRRRLVGVVCLLGAGLGAARAPYSDAPEPALQEADARARYRADLEHLTRNGGVWITSNAAHAAADGGTVRYGQHFKTELGGLAATGCLWGEGPTGTKTVHWFFFQTWDPEAQKSLMYQSSPFGAIGMGHETMESARVGAMEQTFWSPAGEPSRVRHLTTSDEESRVTESFNWIDGAWAAARSYTWYRNADTPPC